MTKPTIIAICGPSASGKDSLARGIVNYLHLRKERGQITNTINLVVSDTTRPPRNNELDGIDYHFLSREQFLNKELHKEYIETYNYGPQNWMYGTPRGSFNAEINVGVFSPSGIKAIKEQFENSYNLYVFYLHDNIFKRLIRSIKRDKGFRWEHLRRAKTDRVDFKNLLNTVTHYKYNFTYIDSSHKSIDSRVQKVYNILCNDKIVSTI